MFAVLDSSKLIKQTKPESRSVGNYSTVVVVGIIDLPTDLFNNFYPFIKSDKSNKAIP